MPEPSFPPEEAPFFRANRAALIAQWGFDPCPGAPDFRPDPVGKPTSLPGAAQSLRLQVGPDDWRNVHDPRDPMGEARAWLSAVHPGVPPRRLAVIGAGEGWIVDVVERSSDDARVLILEPEPAFAVALLSRRDYRPLIEQKRLMVIAGPRFEGAAVAWRFYGRSIDETAPLVHPVIAAARRDLAIAAARIARQALADAASNEHARRRFAAPYLLNTLANLAVVDREADAGGLFDLHRGRPIVVAGAGPSLNRNLDELRPLRDRVVLIAADTALRPCLAAGLTPDFVVAVDPGAANARHLSSLPDIGAAALVAEVSVQPATFAAFEGRTFLFRVAEHQPWPWLQQAGVEVSILRAWGSVLITAFDLGVRLGGDPIVTIGADLAYTNGQPYCRGTVYEEDWTRRVAAGESLPEIWKGAMAMHPNVIERCDGRDVVTTPHFVQFRNGLLHGAQASGRRVINATGAGILRGSVVEQLPLADVLRGAPPIPRPAPRRALQKADTRRRLRAALEAERAAAAVGHSRSEWLEIMAEHIPPTDALVHDLPRVVAESAARLAASAVPASDRDVPADELGDTRETVRLGK